MTELSDTRRSPRSRSRIEAAEEAIYNALCMATTVTGYRGATVEALPLARVAELIAACERQRPAYPASRHTC